MGLNGYTRLLKERMAMLETFPTRIQKVAEKYGERYVEQNIVTSSLAPAIVRFSDTCYALAIR